MKTFRGSAVNDSTMHGRTSKPSTPFRAANPDYLMILGATDGPHQDMTNPA